jgi:hypothetical protein
VGQGQRYLTLDSWETRADYELFRQVHAKEYLAIDGVCEGLTERETKIGEFGPTSSWESQSAHD